LPNLKQKKITKQKVKETVMTDGILTSYMNTWKNWNKMNGVMGKREFWSSVLTALVILAVLLWFSDKISILGFLPKIFSLVNLPAFFTATVRRLHDVNKSGWFLLFIFLPIAGALGIFAFTIFDSDPKSRFR